MDFHFDIYASVSKLTASSDSGVSNRGPSAWLVESGTEATHVSGGG